MKVSPSHHNSAHRDQAMRADHHEDHEAQVQVISSRDRPPSASSSPPESPGPASNQTPLLTASLNAPPRSYYGGLNGNVRVKCPTDLSVTLTTKNRKTPETDSQHSHDSRSQGLSSQSSRQQSVLSNLLKQLGNRNVGPAQQIHVVPIKHIKKEKGSSSKSQPFRCPACSKRFQRHIAMNAHFQNEHIPPTSASASGERSCKLCGTSAPSLAAIKGHLRSQHNIDFENPEKCLAEPDTAAFSSSKYSVLEASLRAGSSPEEAEPSCSNIEMSVSEAASRSCSPLPAHTTSQASSSSEQSPERQSLFPLKTMAETQAVDDDLGQVEDLSLRRPAPASPRSDSPLHKRLRLREAQSPSPTFSPSQSGRASPPPTSGRFTCTHCCITYPNQTLYFLHKGFHSDSNPWRCNGCGHQATDMYDFMSHLFSAAHQ